ncbi:LuxR C-terminal-related transcriptional regulator [Paenibacillus sp. Dod16]|uniref:helix-turn-helix transcriptional regulator n=1 Tax=Paenibacillus sp. Dod16 TaxID=3416392 RepID=UPI003CEDEFC2
MGQRTLVEVNNHFPNILSMTEMKQRLIERKEILYLLQEETRNMNNLLSIPYLFVITDADGAVIDYCGTGSLRSFLERNNIKNGTSLAMKDAGSNAISLSMEQQALSVVIGAEHCNRVFSELACVCTPLRIKNVIIGYLGLSFHYLHEVTFAIPLIEHLAKNIEEKSPQKDPVLQRELIYSHFHQYELTNREKEIAYGWLENKNVPEIADIYGISQSTVRTFIKKIYAKTRVNHKGAFLKKFT